MFCKKCKVNWSRLENDGDNGDYCPLCKSDIFLTDQKQGATYFMDLNMNIVEVGTGNILHKPTPELPKQKAVAPPLYTKTIEEHERDQEIRASAVDAYMKTGDENEYFRICGTIKN